MSAGSRATDVERAKALLDRTAELLAAMEEEVERLHAENARAWDRVRDWEATLGVILPEDRFPLGPDAAVHAAGTAPESGTESADGPSSVYALPGQGVKVLRRE